MLKSAAFVDVQSNGVRSSVSHANAVLALPGLGGFPNQLGTQMVDWYHRNGFSVSALDVYHVRNEQNRVIGYADVYNPALVAETVGREIQSLIGSHDHVIIEGISLGGRAAFDALQWLKDHGDYDRKKVSVILEGAPMDANCIQGAKLRTSSRVISRMPLTMLRSLSAKPMFGLLDSSDIEPGVDGSLLRKNLARAQNLSMAMFVSQLRSFVARDGALPADDQWAGLADRVIFVYFEGDDSVVCQDVAVRKWSEALGVRVSARDASMSLRSWTSDINDATGEYGPFGVVVVANGERKARHAAFVEQPTANVTAHEQILRMLGFWH